MKYKTTESTKLVFDNYGEYLYFTKHLSTHQKSSIFENLSKEEKKSLEKAFVLEGWDDVFWQNEFDKKLDLIKKIFNKDLIKMKIQINKGEKIKIKKVMWEQIVEEFRSVPDNIKNIIFNSIVYKADKVNINFIILQKGKFK